MKGISLKMFAIATLLSDGSGSFIVQKKQDGLVQVCSSLHMLAIVVWVVEVVKGLIFFFLRESMELTKIGFRILYLLRVNGLYKEL